MPGAGRSRKNHPFWKENVTVAPGASIGDDVLQLAPWHCQVESPLAALITGQFRRDTYSSWTSKSPPFVQEQLAAFIVNMNVPIHLPVIAYRLIHL